jgi:hypothetical protein
MLSTEASIKDWHKEINIKEGKMLGDILLLGVRGQSPLLGNWSRV